MGQPEFRLIIPTWNEVKRLKSCVNALWSALPNAPIWVADAHSPDGTADLALKLGCSVVMTRKGRGTQLRAGAEAALAGDWNNDTVLVFVHADTHLTPKAGEELQTAFTKKHVHASLFRARFDQRHWLLWLYSQFTRWDNFWVSFGDQVIACRAKLYCQVGGFSERPSFEDVEFLQRVRRHTKVHRLKTWITTSARMFNTWGFLGQQWRNAVLMYAYLRGASPEELYQRYYRRTFSSQPVSRAST